MTQILDLKMFNVANQVRLALKMKLSLYGWYRGSVVVMNNGEYNVRIHVKKVDNEVRKIIPQVVNGISVRAEAD
jgi:hypothetical protein